jgi:hypothetical protein
MASDSRRLSSPTTTGECLHHGGLPFLKTEGKSIPQTVVNLEDRSLQGRFAGDKSGALSAIAG